MANQIRERNKGRVLIHSVVFGEDANHQFMQRISAENNGIVTRMADYKLDAAAAVSFKQFNYLFIDWLKLFIDVLLIFFVR